MEPLKNTGKLYFYYFLVVFIFISSYVILLLSLHAGGTFYIFLQNGIISIMTILYTLLELFGFISIYTI